MSRSWFKCAECGIECDNSVLEPGYESSTLKICQVCEKSFCPVCDSLYDQPTPTPGMGWMAHCVECGHWDFFDTEIARNIVKLNRAERKEANQ